MAILTQKLIATWANNTDQYNPDLRAARTIEINSLIEQGKTDGAFVLISPTITSRNFLDVSSAQEFADWCINECITLSIPSPSYEITPL
jgi:hypothetical protein